MATQFLGVLVSWYGRKTWTAEELRILESLNKTLPYEDCEDECYYKEFESTGLEAELAKLDPSTLTAALSNPDLLRLPASSASRSATFPTFFSSFSFIRPSKAVGK